MASGASGDRRIGSSRRSMTVLGKIPAPAVPKPINLPSQKLESKGLEPNVEIVPRGTFTWGSRNGPTANKLPAPNIASSPPSSGAWADAAKRKILTVSGSDAGIQPPSPGSSIRPSSAPTTGRAWDTVARSQSHEESIVFDANRVESSILGSQRSIDALPHKNDTGYLDRPISADGTSSDKDRNSTPLHTGLISHVRAVSGPDVAVFPHSGDSQDHYIQQVIPSARVHDPRAGIGIYPRPPHHDVFYPPGVSHYNNVKDRDMVVVTMVGNTGYYGNYAPQVGHPEYYMQPQVYGSYPPHAHHSEQFDRRSHANRGVWSHNLGMGYNQDGDISSCAVEGFVETENDVRKQGDGLFGSGSVLRTEQNHRISKVSGRDKFHNGESGDSGSHTTTIHGGISSSMPSAERKIVLLTKTSRAEEQNNMEMSNNVETGSSGTERNVEKQKNEVLSTLSSADSKYDMEWESAKDMSAPLVEDMKEIPEPKLVNHRTMSESDGGDTEKSTNPQKVSVMRDTATLVAEGHESLNKETPKTTTTADPPLKDEHKVRSRLHNQKTGKEWRPKSPATDSQSSHCYTTTKLNEQAPSAGIAEMQQAQLSGDFSVRSDKEKPDTVSTETGYHTGRKHRKEFSATGTNAASNPDTCAEDSKSVSADSLPLKDDSKSKMKQGGLKGEREWRPKSPAVEPLSAVQSSKIELAHVSDVEHMNSEKKKFGEQETCDVYDYEGQRAKLKENATQRAMQRRREEEERAKEQKAKALAKLKELERRTAAHNSTVETSEHDTVVVDDNVVNDDGANDSAKVRHKRKPKSSKHTAKDSSSHEVNATEGLTDKNLDGTLVFPSSKIGAKLKMEKTELLETSTGSFTTLEKSIDESDKNAKRLQFSANTQKNQVQFEEVLDLQDQSPREKTPSKNKKNEGAKAGRLRQERRYSTEENISKGSYRETVKKGSTQPFVENEDDKELALSVHGEVHARAESIRPTSAPQYTREGGQYRQKHMVESDANIPDRRIDTPGVPDGEGLDQHTRQERTGNNKVMPSPNEIVISLEAKQAKGFDARYSSEKSGRLLVSWKQKNSSKDNPPDGEHAIGNKSKHTENHSEGNSDSRKHKVRNGRKQSSKSNQQVSILPETVDSYPMEENKHEVPVPIPTSSNLEEIKGNESIKSGRSQNSWRQKNNNGHPSSIISSFGETATDLEDPDPRGHYLEFPQENGNDLPPSSEMINSNVRNNLKQSHKGGSAAPMWQKNRAMRSNATGQAKSQHAVDDGFMGQQGRHISSKQMWDGKHLQENDNQVPPTQRKNSPQWHAEPAIYSEVNEQGHKQPGVASKQHQETDNQFQPNQRRNAPQRLSEPIFSEAHIQGHKQSGMSSINRNRAKFESHKSHRQYHPASQVKPSDEQFESKAERTNHPENWHEQGVYKAERTNRSENRHGQGREKASKQAQLSACSTSAEFERKDSGPVIKTEISY